MHRKLIPISICLCLLPAVSLLRAQQPREIPRAGTPLWIDGNLDEPAWQSAPAFPPFAFPWYRSGKKEQTQAKMLWDDRCLYVIFRCEDAHISASRTQRNDEVYKDDAVELFIAPNIATPMVYMNFEINCLGTYLAGIHPDRQTKQRIEVGGLQLGRSHKGTINDEDDLDDWWILEMAVPWTAFTWTGMSIPPVPGTRMRLNLHRLGGNANPQYSMWRPGNTPEPAMHVPEIFGEVVLSDKAP